MAGALDLALVAAEFVGHASYSVRYDSILPISALSIFSLGLNAVCFVSL